jgi:hypothetical protein
VQQLARDWPVLTARLVAAKTTRSYQTAASGRKTFGGRVERLPCMLRTREKLHWFPAFALLPLKRLWFCDTTDRSSPVQSMDLWAYQNGAQIAPSPVQECPPTTPLCGIVQRHIAGRVFGRCTGCRRWRPSWSSRFGGANTMRVVLADSLAQGISTNSQVKSRLAAI